MRVRRALCAMAALLTMSMTATAKDPALKDAFKKHFLIGAAISTDQALGKDPRAMETVAEQFSSITPENLLKWQEVHPQPGQFEFEAADKYVDFGERHRLFIVGHNLVWHNQTPSWVFESESDTPLSKATLITRLHDHISAVVGRYKGRINGWDVLNEAIEDDGSM